VIARACSALPQRSVHRLRARDDEQARGVAIEAVDDPGARGVLAACGDAGERLGERPALVAAGRDARRRPRLVDDEQVLVAVGHRVGRVGTLGGLAAPGRLVDGDDLARREAVALGSRAPVDQHRPGLDQALGACPRAQRSGEERVEPLALVLRRRAQLHRAGRSVT
jgi:hypothetical protein